MVKFKSQVGADSESRVTNHESRVLITGAGGFLGSHLMHRAPETHGVFGLFRPTSAGGDAGQTVRADLSSHDTLSTVLEELRPEVVIHAGALSGEAACRNDASYTEAVNVTSTRILHDYAQRSGAYLIFTSTDLVFDGRHAPYAEADTMSSELAYGRSKIDAEAAMYGGAAGLIVRLPLLYGIGRGERKGMLFHFIEQCRAGMEQGLFTDEYRTPAWVNDVADFLWQLVALRPKGILHLGGRERVSRWDLGQAFAQGLDLDTSKLQQTTRAQVGMENRPEDTSLLSAPAYAAGYQPRSLAEAVKVIRAEL